MTDARPPVIVHNRRWWMMLHPAIINADTDMNGCGAFYITPLEFVHDANLKSSLIYKFITFPMCPTVAQRNDAWKWRISNNAVLLPLLFCPGIVWCNTSKGLHRLPAVTSCSGPKKKQSTLVSHRHNSFLLGKQRSPMFFIPLEKNFPWIRVNIKTTTAISFLILFPWRRDLNFAALMSLYLVNTH